MSKRVDAMRAHIHQHVRPGCAEEHALARAERHIKDRQTRREAIELILHTAAVPEQHWRPILDAHVKRGGADEELLVALGGDSDDGIARAMRHVKGHMTHDEVVYMLATQLGLPPMGGAAEKSPS